MAQKLKKIALVASLALATIFLALQAQAQDKMPAVLPANWDNVLNEARGQTVYFNAWGGDPKINAFLEWLSDVARSRYDIHLQHVKLAATSDAVARVRSEMRANERDNGSVDLLWINGENFAMMKSGNMLFGPFAEQLPNFKYVDRIGKPATLKDFTQATDGYESPWAMAQLVFEYDPQFVPTVPKNSTELLAWITKNPGRFTYPQPPDYLGTTFLKQILYEVISDRVVLQSPATQAIYEKETAKLWQWLDAAHPFMWRQGQGFPASESALAQLLADSEVAISFSFNPGRASAEISAGNLNPNIRSFVFENGTIGNVSFVAIPLNSKNKFGSLVISNLLLDPLVQARAQDPAILGFMTVLDIKLLNLEDQAAFSQLDLGVATLAPDLLGKSLLEPDVSWMSMIAQDWQKRYGVLK